MRNIGIALIGLGTVGQNVLKIIRENEKYFIEEYDTRFQVNFAYVRDINKKRKVSLENITVTDKIERILNSPQVDICIECMGGSGTEETYDVVSRLIEYGKHIVMSSKKCLALYKNEIVDMVNRCNVQLRFDATVGGSIPICKVFRNLSGFDPVNKVFGIANATTNYVLTLMCNEGMDYEEALAKAREKGYAENDASEDLGGWDALYKMCILLRFGMGIDVDPREMSPEGPETLKNLFDDKTEGKVKQIFYAERLADDRIDYYVGPTVVPGNEVMSNVEGRNNMIFVEHKYGGVRAYYGAGAGGKETAAIMVEDMIDIYENIRNSIFISE